MKKLNNTIVSSTPPSDKNSMWYDGKSLYINNKGIWEPVTSPGGGGGGTSSEFMVNINYDDLVALRDAGKLVPGCKYRIIDYETTTSAAETKSAGHLFDIIVTALDNSHLSEQASAIWSERDTEGYFSKSNLPKWQVWYCLDNDSKRFSWALKRSKYAFWSMGDDADCLATLEGQIDYNGQLYYSWVGSMMGMSIQILTITDDPTQNQELSKMLSQGVELPSYMFQHPTEVFESTEDGKGVIYRLIDEHSNDIPWDFKNIMFTRKIDDSGSIDNENGVDTFVYTFTVEHNTQIMDYTMVSAMTDMACGHNVIQDMAGMSWNVVFYTEAIGETDGLYAGDLFSQNVFLAGPVTNVTLTGNNSGNRSNGSLTNVTFDNVNRVAFNGFIEDSRISNCSEVTANGALRYTDLYNIKGATIFSRIDGKKDSIITIDGNNYTDNLCIYQDNEDNIHIVETANIFKIE